MYILCAFPVVVLVFDFVVPHWQTTESGGGGGSQRQPVVQRAGRGMHDFIRVSPH